MTALFKGKKIIEQFQNFILIFAENKMKKLLITVLAVFYLGTSSGATVHFHYCMGELIEWGLSDDSSEGENDCSNCGMKKGVYENCCKDQKQELKIKDSQKAPLSIFQAKIFAMEPVIYPILQVKALPPFSEHYSFNNSVPRTGKTPVFIRNCNFRI